MRVSRLSLAALLLSMPALTPAQSLTTGKIDDAMRRSGQKSGDVYRIGFPRTDLHVTVGGGEIKPGLALGSWAAFSGNDEEAMVMGDLVLLENEVSPVIKALRSSGFQISAVHNHLNNESPHVLYVHYMGRGAVAQIAKNLHDALAHSKTPLEKPATAPATSPEVPAFVKTINGTLGTSGKFAGGVLSFGIPRAETISDHGATLTAAQGVAEAINFQEFGASQVATTGDFVLTAEEVNPVLSALLDHDIQVTALHSHLLTEEPRLFFMHFWATGAPDSVAQGIKAALAKVRTK